MNKITEGSKWKTVYNINIVVLAVHEEGIMYKYNNESDNIGLIAAMFKEDFLDFFTPLPKTRKVFRLYKLLEDKNYTSKDKAHAILHGQYLESEGKTKFATQSILDDNWLVEEEIK
jgi:hypothetical protein